METEFQLELLCDGLHKVHFNNNNEYIAKIYEYVKDFVKIDTINVTFYFWKISRYKIMDLTLNSKFIYIPITTAPANIGIIDMYTFPATIYFITDTYSNNIPIFNDNIYMFNYTNTSVYSIILQILNG